MTKGVSYRRSFHSERDLKVVDNILDLEETLTRRRSIVDKRIPTADGGFEAPRNSLDVSIGGLLDMRRHGHAKPTEVPIGYELSRSYTTTRRRNEEAATLKFSSVDLDYLRSRPTVKPNAEHESKPRSSSVVARLMGLDPLPRQEDLQTSKHPSSRRLLPEELFTPVSKPAPAPEPNRSPKYVCEPVARSDHSGYGELPFRNHPQEQQLEEFKKEFTARQALRGRSVGDADKDRQCFNLESLQDSEEFQDALDFLHNNREFFARVLNNPNSLFMKHLQQGPGASYTGKDALKPKAASLTRSFSESRKDYHSSISHVNDVSPMRRKQDMVFQNTMYDHHPDSFHHGEELPVYSHSRHVSPHPDQSMPTRIVVLKPNMKKQSYNKFSSPMSPSSQSDSSMGSRIRIDGKENMKKISKERKQTRTEVGSVKEPNKSPSKDGLQDARDIARQIMKQVKEDMSKMLLKEVVDPLDSNLRSRSPNASGRLPPNAGFWDSGTSDSESYYAPSRKVLKDNAKLYSSLPSSPRISRPHPDDEHRSSGYNGRRGPLHVERTVSRSLMSLPNSKDLVSSDGVSRQNADSSIKQDNSRDIRNVSRVGAGQRNRPIKEVDVKGDQPKVLPRSLSAPASASPDSRVLEKSGTATDTSNSNRARSSETSLFKGRLLSFMSSKKRNSKRQTSSQCTTSSDLSEDSSQPQSTVEQEGSLLSARKDSCHDSSVCSSESSVMMGDVESKDNLDTPCASDVLSDSVVTPKGIRQWGSASDLIDTSSEASVEKCEQPSPVSVLDIPFHDESPSSVDTRSTDSNCRDIRVELSSFEEGERLEQSCANEDPTPALQSSFGSSEDLDLAYDSIDRVAPSTNQWDIPSSVGREEEISYIRDVLIFTGFTSDGVVKQNAVSAEHGLDMSTFERLEDYYEKRCRDSEVSSSGVEAPLDLLDRKLLFDVVDEILSRKLQKPSLQPWMKSNTFNLKSHCLYTGKKLLEQIWSELSYHCFQPSESEEETFDDLAAKDLTKESPWGHSEADVQMVAIELERLICGDLIREVVHEFVRT